MITKLKALLPVLACLWVAWVCVSGLTGFPEARGLTRSIAGAASSQQPGANSGTAHTPPAGSQERQDVMDGLRGEQKVVFKVHYLKVHGDWAWVDVTPLDDKGRPVAEGGPSLMHRENGAWKAMDLSLIPQDPDEPLEAEDAKPKFVKKVQAVFPGVPSDIFPRPTRSK